jgi:hypothetical protein
MYSASWVGVDGETNTSLIQTGTEQDSSDGYYAWMEILPAYQLQIVQPDGDLAPVEPGDDITASVAEVSAGVWTIYLDDETQAWYFEQNFDYSGPGASVEWIEEAPTVNGSQSVPANFGTVPFSETGIYGDFGSGPGWYSTDMSAANEVAMVNQSDTRILAMPSAPSADSVDGQAFTDTYVTAPSAPRQLTAGARHRSVALSWSAPAKTGGTPIVGYYVREYRSGGLVRTMSVATTSTKIPGLVAGGSYSFASAAHSGGNYTSAYSARTPAVRPKK